MNNTPNNNQENETVNQESAGAVNAFRTKNGIYPLMWGVLALLMAVLTVLFPFAAVVTVAFGSLCFALMKLYAPSRAYEVLIPVAAMLAALLIFDSLTLAALLLATFLPGGYMLAWIIGTRRNFTYAVASQFLVYALSAVAVFLVLLGEVGEFELKAIVEPFKATVNEASGQIYDVLISFPYDGFNVTRDNFIYSCYQTVIAIIPSFIAIFNLATGTLSYWMAKSILRRKRNVDPESVKFFSNFDLFRVSPAGGAVYLIASILGFLVTTSNAVVIVGTVDTVMNAVFCYGGASVIGFFMKMHGVGNGVRGFVYFLLVALCLFVPGPSSILSLIGLFDCFWNVRRFIRPSAKYM